MPLIKYGLPILTPTASSSGLADLSHYVFRNAMTRSFQAKFLAEYAVNTLGLRRFVIFYPDANFGQEAKDAFLGEIESLGAEVVEVVSYKRSQNDFKPQILEIGGISDSQLKKLTLKKLSDIENNSHNKNGSTLSKPVIEKGLWNEDTSITFNSEGADAGLIATLDETLTATNSINVTSLRPFLNRTVDFLKLDMLNKMARQLSM